MELLEQLKNLANSAGDVYVGARSAALNAAQGVGALRPAEICACATDILYTIAAMLRDGCMPRRSKLKLALAAGYFILPVDGLPGALDDVYVGLAALASVVKDVGCDALADYWPGDAELLRRFVGIMHSFDAAAGAGAVRRLAEKLGFSATIEVTRD